MWHASAGDGAVYLLLGWRWPKPGSLALLCVAFVSFEEKQNFEASVSRQY